MAVIILTLLFVIASFLYYHFTKYNKYWKDKGVVGPKPSFFFGNVKDAVLRKKPYGVVFKDIYDTYRPEDKVVGMFVMRSPELLVRDLDVVKHILIKDFDIFVNRGVEFGGLGKNLFNADGDSWRVLRRRFSPLFTSGKLKNMMYLLTERGDTFLEYVTRITEVNKEQEVHGMVQKFTQAAIAACAFGVDMDTFTKEHETLRRIDRKMFTVSFGRELEMMYPGILKKIGGSLFPKEVSTFFLSLVKHVITQRNGEPTDRNDFMDLILNLRKEKNVSGPVRENDDTAERSLDITDEVMAAQAFVFYSAGYETSASTMGFLLYQLALNPEIQDKVVEEINEVLKKHNGEMTLQAVLDLNYMGKVFDETLRMYPIVADLRRKSSSTYKVPGTNVTIEKNQLVKIPVLGIHYDRRIYPNPEVFDPERFSPENVAARHSCAFLPFGLGPRHCIGIRFAQVQSRVCLAKLLSQFRVEPSKNTPRQFQYEPRRVVLYPKGGFPINFVKRH